jgi:hypothetical protein
MKRYLPDQSNVKIDYKIIDDDTNEICWILIIFELRYTLVSEEKVEVEEKKTL